MACCIRNQCVLTLFAFALRRVVPSVADWVRVMHVSPHMAWKMPALWAMHLQRGPVEAAELDRLCKQLAELGRDSDAKANNALLSSLVLKLTDFCPSLIGRVFLKRLFAHPD